MSVISRQFSSKNEKQHLRNRRKTFIAPQKSFFFCRFPMKENFEHHKKI
jgi:hypothetical protein